MALLKLRQFFSGVFNPERDTATLNAILEEIYRTLTKGLTSANVQPGTTGGDIVVAPGGTIDDSTLPNTPPLKPTSISLTSGIKQDTGLAFIDATWVQPGTVVAASWEVRWRRQAEPLYSYMSTGTQSLRLDDLIPNETYEVGVQAVGRTGLQSGYAPADITIIAAIDIIPPEQVTGLTVGAGFQTLTASWNDLPIIDFDSYEAYLATNNTFTTDLDIKKIKGSLVSFTGLSTSTTYYVKVRAKDLSGNYGPFSDVVSGTTGQIVGPDIVNEAIDQTKVISSMRLVEIVSALPAAGTQGRVVFLTTDGKLYRDTGTAWTAAVPTVDLTGQITTTQLTDGAVTSVKIGDSQVITTKLASGVVDKTKVSSGFALIEKVTVLPALPNANYPEGYVVFLTTDSKLYRSTGTSWTAAVPAGDVSGQITSTQIADDSISTPKLAANAVTAAKITAGTITSNQIAADTIVGGNIAAGAIATGELAAGAVTAAKITAGTITGNEIAATTITGGNIAGDTITAGKIATGAITADELAANAVIAGKIATNTIVAGDGVIGNAAIGNLQVANGAIDELKVANGAITNLKVANGAITTLKVQDGQITNAKISDLQVTKLTAGTLSVGVLLSGNIRTSDTGSRVIIDTTGIKFYDSAGTNTVNLAIGGSATFTGAITGSTITGGTIQTAQSPNRRIALTDVGGNVHVLRFYSGNGLETAQAQSSVSLSADLFLSSGSISSNAISTIQLSPGGVIFLTTAGSPRLRVGTTSLGISLDLFMESHKIQLTSSANNDFLAYDSSLAGTVLNGVSRAGIRAAEAGGGMEIADASGVIKSVNNTNTAFNDHQANAHINISDPQFKQNRRPVGAGLLAKLNQSVVYSYNRVDDPITDRIGLLATEVPPELVYPMSLQNIDGDEIIVKGIGTGEAIAFLWGALKELNTKVEELGRPA